MFEPGSFVPLLLAKAKQRIALIPTPDWSERDYDIDADPLWTYSPEPQPFEQLYFYHTDHLGTPQELTDAEGNLAWSADYKAWGEAKAVISEAAKRAGITNPLRFQGQYFDHEIGLHYNRHRYYDPSVGRFISKDPIGLMGGLNIFAYAPNPVEWVDPWGLTPTNGRKQNSNKPNQNAKCPCRKKWEVTCYDRTYHGHISGVRPVNYYRDSATGQWWSEDKTGHGGSTWKVHDKNGAWVADADLYGDYMSKHKSEAGKNIDFKSMKCKDVK